MRVVLTLFLALALSGAALAQEVLYQENFTDGSLALEWFSVWEGGQSIAAEPLAEAPDGDGWVGSLSNEGSGGGVGTACFGDWSMSDYTLEAWVLTTVGTSSYNGIVARMDTTGGHAYYSLRADFDSDQRLQLVKYPGESFGPTVLAEWTGDAVPGGVPTEDSWHKMRLDCIGDQLTAYFDDTQLDGTPITVSTDDNTLLESGVPGIYIFNFMGTAMTKVDSVVVTDGQASSVEETTISIPSTAHITSAYPNPFNPETTISFTTPGATKVNLAVFDLMGRRVATLADGTVNSGVTRVSWNAANHPAGTYFVVLKANGAQDVRKVSLLK